MDTSVPDARGLKLREMLNATATLESSQRGLRLVTRPSDVIIAGPPRCGTNWMQQIVHQLRTGGDMEFERIFDVIPWLSAAHDFNTDLDADQKAEPRAFKVHITYEDCPKECRYIAVYRDPCAAGYSLFKLFEGNAFSGDAVSVEEFFNGYYLNEPKESARPYDITYFQHLCSWYKQRHDPNVLFIFYDDMIEDRELVVRNVANFIGIKEEKNIKAAIELSSFQVMKAHANKFTVVVPSPPEVQAKLGPKYVLQVVRKGLPTEARNAMSEETKARVQAMWDDTVGKETGYKTFDDLRRGIRKDLPLK